MPDYNVTRLNDRVAISTKINPHLPIAFRLPTAVIWNRLEGRPRSDDLTRPMRAEVRDPLWLLARQWQLGEFKGEDAAVPVNAHLATTETPVTGVKLGLGTFRAYDGALPIEALVEARPLNFDLLSSLHIGQWWRHDLEKRFGASARNLVNRFRQVYAIAKPAPTPPGEVPTLEAIKLTTHRRELQLRLAVAGSGIDGAALFADARTDDPVASFRDRGVVVSAAQAAGVAAAAASLVDRVGALFLTPKGGEDAWDARRLEYDLAIAAGDGQGTQTKLEALGYPGGRLDWYSFDATSRAPLEEDQDAEMLAQPTTKILPFIPTPVRFAGMPNVRWWEFETRRVGFGLTSAAKSDLVRLLLGNFGTVFGNDWFIVPLPSRIATLIDVMGILVSDNFGGQMLIESTARRHEGLGLTGTWTMWRLSHKEGNEGETPVLLAPTLPRSHESKPVEEVQFLRDESANLVWGVETVIPDTLGGGRDGREAGQRLRDTILSAYGPEPAGEDPLPQVPLRYTLMTSVPEHWIPFVTVSEEGEPAARLLLQGAMPRVPPLAPTGAEANLGDTVVLPRGGILSRNPLEANLINEEEITRDGLVLRRTFQMTRWTGATRVAWNGLTRRNGRGEGASGLFFDQVRSKSK